MVTYEMVTYEMVTHEMVTHGVPAQVYLSRSSCTCTCYSSSLITFSRVLHKLPPLGMSLLLMSYCDNDDDNNGDEYDDGDGDDGDDDDDGDSDALNICLSVKVPGCNVLSNRVM
ncbi:hypothetical protein FHG87_006555 [Trinorchestia longiramus]|nr:hypothetical protein FHG87_006555 [Trinorchestia longiramus]